MDRGGAERGERRYPLSDFNSWGLAGGAVKSGPTSGVISSFPDAEITMVDTSGNVVAQPGSLGSGSSAFTIAWLRGTWPQFRG